MPGQFVQSYWVRLEVAGSGDGVHESDVALTLSLWVGVSAGLFWVRSSKNLRCLQK